MGQCSSKKANTNTQGVSTVKPNLLENTKQDPTKVETVPNVAVEIKEEAQIENTVVDVEVETTEVNLEETVNIDDTECVDGQVEKDIREGKDQCCAHEACCENQEEAEEEVKKEQESNTSLIMMHEEKGEEDEKEQDGVQKVLSTSVPVRLQPDDAMEVSMAISAYSVPATLQPEIKSNDTPLSKESKTTDLIQGLDVDESIPASAFCNLCASVKNPEESSGNIEVTHV